MVNSQRELFLFSVKCDFHKPKVNKINGCSKHQDPRTNEKLKSVAAEGCEGKPQIGC